MGKEMTQVGGQYIKSKDACIDANICMANRKKLWISS
jgi:hypothetical protein